MSTNPVLSYQPEDLWPDSDGRPMADNTEQYEWIVRIKENLELLFADRPDVFVAGDLLWYPLRDHTPPVAPDVLVAFGRPKGRRGSYKQWEEAGIAPQVVFEILSPSNTKKEMEKKFNFYRRYGAEEYYIYDPDRNHLTGWRRHGHWLTKISNMKGWRSPLLGIRFEPEGASLELYYPDGQPFLNFLEIDARRRQAEAEARQQRRRAETEHRRAERQRRRAEEEQRRADQEYQRAEEAQAALDAERRKVLEMKEHLRKLGIEWESL